MSSNSRLIRNYLKEGKGENTKILIAKFRSSRTMRRGKAILVGLGNPLLDITAPVELAFLDKYKLAQNSAHLVTSENEELLMPIFEEVLAQHQVELLPGGSVLNTFRVFQWTLDQIEDEGNFGTFFGAVGEDRHGHMLMNKCREEGVDVRLQQIWGVPTGKCATLINGANRSMCALLGAANSFTADFLDQPVNRVIIEQAEFFYTAGFFLTVSPEAVLRLAKLAADSNKLFCFNLSASYVPSKCNDQLNGVLPFVDILFGNDDEARAYAVENGFGEGEDLGQIARKMAGIDKANKKRERLVLITQAHRPVIVARGGTETVELFSVPAIPEGRFVDSNGAGDAFVGGFIAALVSGHCFAKCMEIGCSSAGTIIQHRGCTFPTQHFY